MRLSDNPQSASLDLLRTLDAEEPGRWIAQPKYDGWRRFAFRYDDGWKWIHKPGGTGGIRPLPPDIKAQFESMPWPEGIGLDMEWMGPRDAGGKDSLHVFDILKNEGEWVGDLPFAKRLFVLAGVWLKMSCDSKGPLPKDVHLVRCTPNPGLMDLFAMQLQDEKSEGLVVRRSDSKIVGHDLKCGVNPHWFKFKFKREKENAV
jgi:ATP-dependent DNA ligase